MPKVVWVRSLVPKEKNSALSARSPARMRRARQLDHGADRVVDRCGPVSAITALATRSVSARRNFISSPLATSGCMISGIGRGLAGGGDLAGRLDDGAHLHLVDLGIGDAQAAAAVAQHGVGLAQLRGPPQQLGGVEPGGLGHRLDLLLGVRQELVQRRVEQADGDRQAVHDRRTARRSRRAASAGSWPGPRGGPASSSARIISRTAAMRVVVEEHVLGAAKADALGAELAGGRWRRAAVSALARTFSRRTSSAQPIRVAKSPDSSGSIILTGAGQDLALASRRW